MILKDFPDRTWKTTPLRLAFGAACKAFGEVGDLGLEGVGLGGGRVLPGVGAVFAGRVFAGAGFDAGAPPGGQQVAQGGPADGAGQVGGAGGQDVGGGGDQVAGGLHHDGEADAVHVQAGPGGDGGGGADERLGGGEQGVDLLVDAGQGARAQDPAIEQGGLDRVVGGFGLPPFVVEGDQLDGGVAGVVGQAGKQPPLLGAGGAISQGDGDRGLDDPDREQRGQD